jgi:putative ABC transport system permease protein
MFTTIGIAMREITANWLRSLLTTLGIIIGVGAVIIVVSLGNGATQKVQTDLSELGNNLLALVPGDQNQGSANRLVNMFTIQDVQALRDEVPTISMATGVLTQVATVVYGNENYYSSVRGTDNDYLTIRNLDVERGRSFTEAELRAGRAVCILGATPRRELFGAQNPIGAEIRLSANSEVTCEVIGLLEEKGADTFGNDQDDYMLAPLNFVQRRVAGNRDVTLIFMNAASEAEREDAIDDVTALMRERRRVRDDDESDFFIQDLKQVQEQVGQVTGIMTLFVSAIAAISLIVGGIGVMNVMLVSVTERTREIGIRLAIGALERDVLTQFLVESILLSVIGGIIGVIFGVSVAWAAAGALNFPFVVSQPAVVIAVAFSAIIGIVFGFFPAWRAARLNPIDALRYE